VCKRSDLETGEAENGRSDARTDVGMGRAMAVTPIRVDPPGAAPLEPMERNKNGQQRRSSQALVSTLGPGHWWSWKE